MGNTLEGIGAVIKGNKDAIELLAEQSDLLMDFDAFDMNGEVTDLLVKQKDTLVAEGEDSTPVCGALYEPSAFTSGEPRLSQFELESRTHGTTQHSKQRPFQLESKAIRLYIAKPILLTRRSVTCALAGRQSVEYPLEQNFHSTHFYFEPQFDIEAILCNYIYLPFCGFHALRQGGLNSGHLVRATNSVDY
ncbi:hypothetical protein B0O99DRAFT_35959 [Bisporella sp. PMI_857]|nr:hypothetical protein B0O99DRAFT_35959 [Bisporella sp. PMI_857]